MNCLKNNTKTVQKTMMEEKFYSKMKLTCETSKVLEITLKIAFNNM